MSKPESLQLVEATVEKITKQYGKGTVMKLGDSKISGDIQVIPTGSVSLDYALGIGGMPKGRIVEVFGKESSGKTTLALHVVASAQAEGGVCAFVDAEHALDTSYASNLGVNTQELLISQPDYGEQGLEIVNFLVSGGGISVIVIDSVAALVPRAELEGEMGDSHMGLQARLMSQAMRKLTGVVSKSNTLVLFINQIRQRIGVLYGDPTTTSGGNALKFYATIRIDISRIGAVKRKVGALEEIVGNRTRAKVVKNKIAPPFKSAEFDIIYGEGISYTGDILDTCVARGIVEKKGAWFAYKEQNLAQGREGTKQYLENNPQMLTMLTALLAKSRL